MFYQNSPPFIYLFLWRAILIPRSLNFKNTMGPESCSSKIRRKSGTSALLTAFQHCPAGSSQFSHSVFATPWTAAHQASLSITNSWSLLKLTSIELIMPSNHLILCRPLLSRLQSSPASGSFQISHLFASGGQSIGVSASASVFPMNIQDWFPLGLTGLISLKSKGLSRVFSNTTVQNHQFFGAQLSSWSNSHIHTWLLEIP